MRGLSPTVSHTKKRKLNMPGRKRARNVSTVLLFIALFCALLGGNIIAAEKGGDVYKLAIKGRKLSSEEAQQLEEKLQKNPDDLSARTMLLGYYGLKAFESNEARTKRQKHIVWIIQNHPDAQIAGLPDSGLNPVLDGQVYYEAKNLWFKQVDIHNKNTAILGNAASFFLIYDRDVAEDLLKKAKALEPKNPEWSERLGHLYALDMSRKSGESRKEEASKALEQMENALSLTPEGEKRFYMLSDLAKQAFEAGDTDKASEYATELLNKAPQYRSDWNYGNAVHHGNLILGRIALEYGQLEKAKKYLLEAGKTPGSPQLNSFGPNMTLAKELLEKGERDIVITYFQLCGKFWRMGTERLKNWTSIVKRGGIPDFGANLSY
jgi:tetratricopeptide (TPR) repeat protein